VSVLVNNAGGVVGQAFDDTDPAIWRGDIELNLSGAFYVTHAALPAMLGRGGGAIVNVATVNALASISEPAYSAAKAGLLQLTRQLAVEYGPRGLRTNAVIPGSIRTPGGTRSGASASRRMWPPRSCSWAAPIWDHRLAKAPQILDVLRRGRLH
jgi:NAD(P)-dependent dehydrogenase (short-subunit alcohol dehydrogenase family)